ncbi:MAG: DUF2341 domain-containing protein [Candidatus Berkelbacteria bacterium]|nr:DUF2341 domain-containing protein [Candidatus Berkelbacteria bacterium]
MKKALNIAKIKAEKVFDYFRQSPHKNKYQVGGVFAIAMIALLIFQSFLFPLNSRAASASWNFSNSGDYTYDNTKVNIAGNQASLKATSAYATDGTGGTITHSGGYTIHTFSAGGTFTPPTGLTSVAALVVAGGGSGGNGRAGGGGAGGLISNSSFAVSTQAYTITVGDGGTSGNNGGNSVFSSLTAIGGGKGNAIGGNGSSGGSGGGAGVNYSGVTPTGGAGTSGQGNVGGNSYGVADNPRNSGGGGGAGSAGVSGALRPDGGTGLANSISGSSVFYAAGGGGGWGGSDRTNYGSGVGGSGIGGNGGSASPNANGTNGTNNTGSGGGGGGDGSGGLGGSGVVIIRYLSVTYPTTHAPGNDWIATDTGHDWSYRKAITISKTNVGSTLTNFPAKIEISADTDIGAHAKSDLTDLRFTSSGGTTILPAERETGAVTAGSASGIFWVQVPSISSSADTIIYAYYGNSSASAQASPSGVWDSNFKGVWHLKETGTNPTVNDSTSNANNSTSQTWTPTSNGQIDGAASMDATQNISMGDVLNFGTGDRTFSLWMKPPNSNQISAILSKRNPTNPYQQYTLGVGYTDSGGIGIASKKFGMFFHDGLGLTNTHCADYYTTNDVVDGNWHHVSLTWSSGVPKIYVDGVSQTLTTVYSGTSVNTDTTAPFLIGNNLYSGLLDQIAVSNSARSADWIKFEYYNQKDAAGQLSYGSQDGFFGYTTANSTAQNYVSVSGFSATTSGTGTTVFQVSPDGGTTWYWYNGSAWAATTNGSWEANTAATINTHFADASFNTYGATIKSFKFRSFFTSDGTQNSILSAVGLTYVLDTAAPAQPAAVVASSQSSGGVTLTDNTWYNYSAPYFSWTASVDQANSGEVATGTAGYYVYFGTNASADPSSYQTGVTYQSSSLTLNNTYYLRLKAKDNAGNISSAWTEFTYKYDQDNEPPQDPAVLTAKKASNGDAITTNNFYNAANPYFSWTPSVDQADTGSGYAHTVTGTAGYYVYFGTDVTAIPCSAGSYQTPANFTSVATLVSGSTYYLRLQPKDNAGNVTMNPASSQTCTNSNVWAPFIYKYDDTAPNSPSYVSVSPSGYSRTNTHTFSWPVSGGDGPSDSSGSGLSKYQYKLGDGDWTDVGGDTTTATISPTNPAYRTGANVFYLRAVDDVGNVDASPSQVTFYYNNSSPTAPTSLTVDPSTSANNSFAFSWSLPLTYGGAIAGYYYSINALPTIVNSTFSSSTSLAAGPYASQQGQNTFYIVAKDNAGNVDFDSCNSIFGNPTTDGCSKVNFTANTSAPGIPTGLQAIDSSNRDAAEYSDVLKWVAPVSQGTGFAGYTVERSTDGLNYSQVATTTGTSYVDDNLSSQLYYYCWAVFILFVCCFHHPDRSLYSTAGNCHSTDIFNQSIFVNDKLDD